jgi:DNA-binding PadR family transcriptional regulator
VRGDKLGEFEELLLLAVRASGDESYGVPVQEYLERVTGRAIAMGAVYAALDRLEHKGFVRSAFGPATPERGGKRKRLFSVTPAGMKMLRDVRRVRDRLWRTIEQA